MAGTVAVPSFTEGVPGLVPVAAALPQRTTVRRSALAIGRKQIIAAIAGIVIYAIVSFIVGNVLLNAQASHNNLLNAIIPSQSSNAYVVSWEHFLVGLFIFIPCFFGAKFGPFTGVVVAVLGALLGDTISQFLPAWSWFVGFAVLGFLPGLAYVRTRGSYKKAGNILLALAYSFVAIVLWSALLLVGDFLSFNVDFGLLPSTLLTLALVQLISLVPLVIALISSNMFAKARTS